MKIENIGGIPVHRDKPFLIVEAGVNHEGSLNKAYEMIEAASDAGADMIKFQAYKARNIASKNSPAYWDREKEACDSQYMLFKKYDTFGIDEYVKLASYCKEKKIQFLATPFDKDYVDSLDSLMAIFKVASADITNFQLLKQIAQKNKPILLSVGASYLSEVEQAVRLLRVNGAEKIALLHCVLQYPTSYENANLLNIPYLKNVFHDLTIGWSDHIQPQHGCLSLIAAWLQGADILEKHYTLDKSLPGNDHYHAMDPDDICEFRKQQVYIQKMLGSKCKTVLPCEKKPRIYARRSLVATQTILAGSVVTEDMVTAKRPGTGISTLDYEKILGRKVIADVREDDILQWDMFFN